MQTPDATKLIIQYLDANMTARVGHRLPDGPPDLFVQVRRTGGTGNRVVDRAQITVTVWGKIGSDNVVNITAGQVRDLLMGAASAAKVPLIRRVEVLSGPYDDDDPRSGRPRASLTVIATIRATRT